MQKLPTTNDEYQIFIFTCPAQRPFNFVIHPWIVAVNNGVITRWEIVHRKYKGKERFGYVYKNFYSNPTQGLKKSIYEIDNWNVKIIGSVSGNKESLSKRIIDLVESPSAYPYKDKYKFFGPNSNTYVSWILQQFPESNIKLPWNAFGKNYN